MRLELRSAIQDLPPVNASSSLLSPQPTLAPSAADDDTCSLARAAFDTFDLHLALTRSSQATGSSGGLRRATSAPHSLDQLGHEAMCGSDDAAPTGSYLPPSGGPMRRVSSSLGMRRSSTPFWTPAAHRRPTARGIEAPGAGQLIAQMGPSWLGPALKLADVDKKLLVQRRVLQTLADRPLLPLHEQRAPLPPPPPPASPITPTASLSEALDLLGTTHNGMHFNGMHFRSRGLVGMATVAEEAAHNYDHGATFLEAF